MFNVIFSHERSNIRGLSPIPLEFEKTNSNLLVHFSSYLFLSKHFLLCNIPYTHFPNTMNILISVRNSDSTSTRLGRLNALLPPEYSLVQILQNVDLPQSDIFNSTSTPACKWFGVRCDHKGNVVGIEWRNMASAQQRLTLTQALIPNFSRAFNLRGIPRWEYLPSTLIALELYVNYDLFGEVPLEVLPTKLEYLDISVNMFSGILDFAELPKNIKTLYLHANCFERVLHLEDFPQSISRLCMSNIMSNILHGASSLRLPNDQQFLWMKGVNCSNGTFRP